ncbi:MAG TPA: HEAT repeat domain-containing protein [Phycisphaerae bacterium]|nr:HEAT repeat domain-containing protein [Phycisphaerae bacterium]
MGGLRRLMWALALVMLATIPVRAEEAPAETTRAPADAEREAAYHKYLKHVRLIEIRHLRTGDEKDFRKGREKVLAIEDEAAVGPLVDVLYGTNRRYRGLLIEAIEKHAQRGSAAATAYLQEIAVGDTSAGHRRRAVEAIQASPSYEGKVATDRLLAHLALDEVSALRNHAAEALARLGEKRAVWLLVERLVTEEMRLVGGEVVEYNMMLDIRGQWVGTPTFRKRQITAAAAGGGLATITVDLPVVEIVDFATTLAMTERHFGPRYERVQVKHPQILAALKRLTEKNFGYDQSAWQKWLQSEEAAGIIPPWELIRFQTDGRSVAEEEQP